MKPENEKKLRDLAEKYPSYFAFVMTKNDLAGFATEDEILEALPLSEKLSILMDIVNGKDEMSRVAKEIEESEKSESLELSPEEDKKVNDLLSFLDK